MVAEVVLRAEKWPAGALALSATRRNLLCDRGLVSPVAGCRNLAELVILVYNSGGTSGVICNCVVSTIL